MERLRQARLQARFGSAAKAALVAGPLFALQHVALAAAAGWTVGSIPRRAGQESGGRPTGVPLAALPVPGT